MDLPAPVVGIAAFLLFFVIVIGVTGYRFTKRKRLWQPWAEQIGWELRPMWDEGHDMFRAGPYGKGKAKETEMAVAGRFDGFTCMSMQYDFLIGSSRGGRTYTYQVFRVIVPGARFPVVQIQPERGIVDAILPDIDFEDQSFSRQWRVTGENRAFAHALIHQRSIEWFKRVPLPQFAYLWVEGDSVMIAQRGRLHPSDVGRYLQAATAWLRTFPPFLLRSVGAAPLPPATGAVGPADHRPAVTP